MTPDTFHPTGRHPSADDIGVARTRVVTRGRTVPVHVRAGLFVEELLGARSTEGEHELGIYRLAAYQPSTARDDLLLTTAGALALDALPRRHAPL
ncbi:unannotated protein [freshwater metagenome]|uniref:Unannotated protein n=1 Tax=freshwater metagenome TaxID=449393 RepID=A0A6J7QAJ2_9ZZZZ